MRMVQKYDKSHKDFLQEIASIGTGNASALLSTLIDKEVNITISTADMVSPKNISNLVSASKRLVIVQYAPIGGELRGNILLVIPRESALSLLDLLQKKKLGTTQWLSKEEQDILKKVSRSLVRCYLDAIKGFLNIEIKYSKLRVFSTFGETINELIDLTLKKRTKKVFYLNTKMSIESNIEGEFYFLFEEGLSSLLMQKAAEMLAR